MANSWNLVPCFRGNISGLLFMFNILIAGFSHTRCPLPQLPSTVALGMVL